MRVRKFPKYTILHVYWQDIISDANWHDSEDIDKASLEPIQTLGFFLQNKKRALKIAHSITDDGASDYTVIPWSVITKIEELKHEC